MSAQATTAPEAAVAEAGLLDQIVDQSKVARSDAEHARAKDIISELAREVLDGTVVVSDNLNLTRPRARAYAIRRAAWPPRLLFTVASSDNADSHAYQGKHCEHIS